jgi:NAD(P)H dehydrogenase (quinone)
MNVLLVLAHPCDDSFTHACASAAVAGLEAAGHTVDVIDLYGVSFTAAMSRAERLAYESPTPILDDQVADHAHRLMRADALVFVYPTWWSGLPAILKGWLERVMVPGVGFVFNDQTGKVRPGLAHVRRIVGISVYGSPHRYTRLMNDNGRRILTRALRMSCGLRARPAWMALYGNDTATADDRTRFLSKITSRMASL